MGGAIQGTPLNLTATVSTLAGDGVLGYADGIGAAARFFNPSGITTDGTVLYVADSSNNRIRKIH
jgi:sugar lactone lactonase YvrE